MSGNKCISGKGPDLVLAVLCVIFCIVRKLVGILGLVLSHTLICGQGYVLFANRYGGTEGVNAPVLEHLEPEGQGPGPEWSAQLFVTNNNSLTPLYPASTFRPIPIAAIFGVPRYWFAQTNQVPGIPAGQSATFIVRAWKTSFGSYESASLAGYAGESSPVTVMLGDVSNPAPLMGLQHFEVGPFNRPSPKLTIESPFLTFSVPTNGTPYSSIETSSNLQNWRPYLSIVSKLNSFRYYDRSAGLPGRFYFPTAFFRVRLGDFQSPILEDWRVAHYRFKFERDCFCFPFRLSGVVEVRNGRIVGLTNVRGNDGPIANPDPAHFKTIEDLFTLIRNDSPRADLFVVAYDPGLLYPRMIDIDYIKGAADDEITYYASELEPLP